MSRFVESLHQAADGATQPLGFGRSPRARLPSMLLLAQLGERKEAAIRAVVDAGADGLLFSSGGGPKKGSGAHPPQVPWGVRLESADGEAIKALKEQGCDFVVVGLDDVLVDALDEEEPGRILRVSVGLEDRLVRGADQLPIEGVLLDVPPAKTLTWRTLLEYAAVTVVWGDTVIAPAPLQWTPGGLEQLRNIGVTGLLVEAGSADGAEELKRLKEAIAALPPRSRRREDRLSPRLPHVSLGGLMRHEEEEEEEEEEERRR
ncbi:MAG: hypothetical protein HY685_06315 [Chloroflexi bacterium]|nr:hypothetical protein [Chloroflexota bacterium]